MHSESSTCPEKATSFILPILHAHLQLDAAQTTRSLLLASVEKFAVKDAEGWQTCSGDLHGGFDGRPDGCRNEAPGDIASLVAELNHNSQTNDTRDQRTEFLESATV